MMRSQISTRRLAVATVIGLLPLAFAAAQDATPAESTPPPPSSSSATTETPTAQGIIDRFIEETGGREAWEAVTSLRGMGRIEVLGTPVVGYITIDQTSDSFRMAVEIPGAGSRVTLRVGDEGWTIGPDGTGVPITGDPLRQLVREKAFNPLLDAATNYSSLDLVGVEQVEGSQAWKIRCVAVDNEDAQEFRFFDISTGMQIKVIEQAKDAPLPTEIFLSDYRSIGSVKIACTTNIGSLRQRMLITMDAMQVNANIPQCLFATPAAPPETPAASGVETPDHPK